ncbi:MAG: tol-pal system protein YbgF [Geminicoccaceae bacterium]
MGRRPVRCLVLSLGLAFLGLGLLDPGAAQAQLAATPSPAAARAAALEARVQELEEALRKLTGRVEELEHQQSQLVARGPGPGTGTPPAQAAAQPPAAPATAPPVALAAPAPGATSRPAAPAPEPDAAAKQGHVLGTIPQSAARDLPNAGDGYQAGLDLLQAAKWAEAEQAFASFVQEHPDDPRTPTASYWLGETYLMRKDYPTAAAVFARNYRSYGEKAPRAPDNLLKLGVALAAMGQRDKACQTFAELAKRHPNVAAPIRQALSRERTAAGCS